MKENSIEETIKQLELILKVRKEQKEIIECAGGSCINCDPDIRALTESIDILSDYKRVLKENELLRKDIESWNKYCEEIEEERIEMSNKNCELEFEVEELQKANEEINKNYNSLIDKIILKIDEYDYKFEKAKKQNKNDIADYYWDLIINFKKLLGGE